MNIYYTTTEGGDISFAFHTKEAHTLYFNLLENRSVERNAEERVIRYYSKMNIGEREIEVHSVMFYLDGISVGIFDSTINGTRPFSGGFKEPILKA